MFLYPFPSRYRYNVQKSLVIAKGYEYIISTATVIWTHMIDLDFSAVVPSICGWLTAEVKSYVISKMMAHLYYLALLQCVIHLPIYKHSTLVLNIYIL